MDGDGDNANIGNPRNSYQTKKKGTFFDAFEWIKTSQDHWHNDFLKWMLLVLCEPKDSSEENNIEIGLKVMEKEIDELCDATNASPDFRKFISGLFEKCNNWRSSTRGEKQRDSIMKEIVIDTLRLEKYFVQNLVDCLIQLQISQRSFL